jgi:hypothetical protein
MKQEEPETLRKLHPHLTAAELSEAQDRVDRYIRLAIKIFERLQNEPGDAECLPFLTDELRRPTLDSERSSEEENKAHT